MVLIWFQVGVCVRADPRRHSAGLLATWSPGNALSDMIEGLSFHMVGSGRRGAALEGVGKSRRCIK